MTMSGGNAGMKIHNEAEHAQANQITCPFCPFEYAGFPFIMRMFGSMWPVDHYMQNRAGYKSFQP